MEPHVRTTDGSSGMGFMMGIILFIIFVFALLYYGLPLLRSGMSTPSVNVPGQIDVNVHNK